MWITALALTVVAAPCQESLDGAARTMFDALAKNDFSAVERALPPVATFDALVAASIEDLDAVDREAARQEFQQRGGAAAVRAEALMGLRRGFERTRERAAERFIWDTASFVAVLPPLAEPIQIGSSELAIAAVDFLVRADGALWVFGATDVLSGPEGWAFVETIGFEGALISEEQVPAAPSEDRDALVRQVADLRDELAWSVRELEHRTAEHAARFEAVVSDLDACQERLDECMRAADERAEALRSEAAEREAQLRDEVERMTNERDVARLEGSEAVEEARAEVAYMRSAHEELRASFQRLELQNVGLRLALARLGGSLDAAGELPAWATADGVPAELRASLSRAVDLDLRAVPRIELLELFSLAVGTNVLLAGTTLDPYEQVDVVADGASLASALEVAFGAESVRVLDGDIVIAEPRILEIVGRASSLDDVSEASWRVLSELRIPARFEQVVGSDLVEFVAAVSNLDFLATTGASRALLDVELTVVAHEELSLARLTTILIAAAGLQTRGGEGYFVLEEPGVDRSDRLPPDVRARLAWHVAVVDLDSGSLADRVDAYSRLFALELSLSDDLGRGLAEETSPPVRAKRTPVSVLLETCAIDVEGRWVKDGHGGLRLVRE